MKKILTIILLTTSLYAHAGKTGHDLLESCNEYNKYITEDINGYDKSASQECISYIQGALDKVLLFYAENDNYEAYICLPDDINQKQTFSVVYEDLLNNKKLNYGAEGNVAGSLARAYPCQINIKSEMDN